MLGIKEAFKRIYAGENWLTKHSIIFVITGITSIFSSYMNTLSNQQTPDPSIIGPCFCGLLALLLITFYLCGYGFNITHNSFDETREEIFLNFTRYSQSSLQFSTSHCCILKTKDFASSITQVKQLPLLQLREQYLSRLSSFLIKISAVTYIISPI